MACKYSGEEFVQEGEEVVEQSYPLTGAARPTQQAIIFAHEIVSLIILCLC